MSRFHLGLALLASLAGAAHAQEGKLPLEVKLTLKRAEFVIARSGKEGEHAFERNNEVVLGVELRNTGKQPLDIIGPPEPQLHLTGPRKESVHAGGGHHFFVPQVRRWHLPAGESAHLLLDRLNYRKDTGQFSVLWTEPGDFRLKAEWSLAVSPAPPGVAAAKLDLGGEELKGKAFGQVTLTSETVKFTVREGDPVRFWTEALEDKDEQVRLAAASVLRQRGKAAAVSGPALARLFAKEKPSIQIEIAQTLESLQKSAGQEAALALRAALDSDPIALRTAAAKALARVAPDAKETPAALLPLLGDLYADVRRAAAEAFHHMGHHGWAPAPKEVDALIDTLKRDPDSFVRYHTLHALYHVSEERVVAAILPFLKNSEAMVKSAALHSLGRLGPFLPKAAKEREDGPVRQALDQLIDLLGDEANLDRNLCESVVYVVGAFREAGAPAVPMLRKVLKYEQFQGKEMGYPRTWIIIAMRNIGPGAKAAAPDLAERLVTDMDWSVRQYSAEALGAFGVEVKKEALKALVQGLDDKMSQVRNASLLALSKMDAVPELIAALDHADGETRNLAASLVSEFKEQAHPAIPTLTKMARGDAHVPCRRTACYVLGSLKAAEAIPQLIEALADKDDIVRAHAARSLGEMNEKTRSAIPALLGLLRKETNAETRYAQAVALYKIDLKGTKEGAADLSPLLDDSRPEMVSVTIQLLGQLGPAAMEAVPALRRLIDRDKSFLRDQAKEALKKIEMK